MKACIFLLVSILSILSTAPLFAAETAFLRPGDVIVCVGDSVTAAGVYDGFLQAMLDCLYPGAGIRIVNRGSGGKSAGPIANQVIHALISEGYLQGDPHSRPARKPLQPIGADDIEPTGGAG